MQAGHPSNANNSLRNSGAASDGSAINKPPDQRLNGRINIFVIRFYRMSLENDQPVAQSQSLDPAIVHEAIQAVCE
jgi:hypothetical protein